MTGGHVHTFLIGWVELYGKIGSALSGCGDKMCTQKEKCIMFITCKDAIIIWLDSTLCLRRQVGSQIHWVRKKDFEVMTFVFCRWWHNFVGSPSGRVWKKPQLYLTPFEKPRNKYVFNDIYITFKVIKRYLHFCIWVKPRDAYDNFSNHSTLSTARVSMNNNKHPIRVTAKHQRVLQLASWPAIMANKKSSYIGLSFYLSLVWSFSGCMCRCVYYCPSVTCVCLQWRPMKKCWRSQRPWRVVRSVNQRFW